MNTDKAKADIKVSVEYFPEMTMEEIIEMVRVKNEAAGHIQGKGD